MAKLKPAAKRQFERMRLLTPIGRLVYPYLAVKDEGRSMSSNKYKTDIMFEKSKWKEQGKELREAVLAMGRDFYGDDSLTLKDFANPFKDGDAKDQEHYKGMVYITVKSDFKPTVVGPDKVAMTEEQVVAIKGGDYARAVVSVYPYTQKDGGVTLGLETVQFARPGEALGGGRAASLEMLDELEVELDDVDVDVTDEEDNEDDVTPAPKKNGKNPVTTAASDDEDDEEPVKKRRGRPAKAAEPEESDSDDDLFA